jgi:hypothetical protein
MLPALQELAVMLGFRGSGTGQFTGSAQGTGTEPGLLYRACLGLTQRDVALNSQPGCDDWLAMPRRFG